MADPKQEEGVKGIELSPAEMADIRKILTTTAEREKENIDLKSKISALEDALSKVGSVDKTKKAGPRTITAWFDRLRKYEDKYVIGWVKKNGHYVYRETDARGNTVEYIDIIVHGIKSPVKMKFLEYINELPQEIVKRKAKRKLESTILNQGEVEKVVFDEKSGVMMGLGYSVPVESEQEHYEMVYDLNGEEVTIHEDFVNR